MRWRSYELRPQAAPPIPAHYRQRIEAARPRLRQMAREHYGLELHEGPFGINSRPALILAKYAEAQGRGKEFHQAAFQAYWQEAQSIDQPEVLQGLLTRAGLAAAAYELAVRDPNHVAAVEADIAQAYAYGLEGVPALIFNNKYLVSGAQPYELLKQVAEKVLAES